MAPKEGKSFTLRLPAELYEPIAAMAERERRSLHGQVLYLLDQVLEDAETIRTTDAAVADDPLGLPLEKARAETDADTLLKQVDALTDRITAAWKDDMSAIDAIREQRR